MTGSRPRLIVIAIAVVATAGKLLVAARTFGTNDVHSWLSFSEGVRRFGPVDMYGHQYFSLYNHPPLSGRMLVAVNWLVDHQVGTFTFLIKVPAVLADLVIAVLVFELVRLRRPIAEAAVAGVLVVCSPALFVISGFHGNTDPLFVMFAVLSVYLLVVKRWAAAAGMAFALALSVKLVPIVLVPMLLVLLVRLGRRRVLTFTAGGTAVFLVLWLPVVLDRWTEFSRDVLGYNGIWAREWGLSQFAVWAHLPAGFTEWFTGPGRFVVLLLSSVLPAAVAWRHRTAFAPAAAGLALAMFLLLSPAFGMQYLVWPLAAAYFVSSSLELAGGCRDLVPAGRHGADGRLLGRTGRSGGVRPAAHPPTARRVLLGRHRPRTTPARLEEEPCRSRLREPLPVSASLWWRTRPLPP